VIDMRSPKHRRDVERALRDAMKDDKARFTVGRISPNGLLEINRQRLKKELALRTHRTCPTCSGTGSIASPELVGLNLLRRIETRAVTGRLKAVRVELHPELADAIQNERRDEIAALESEFGIRVQVIAASGLHRSEEHIEWFQREDTEASPVPAAAVTVADLADGVTAPGAGDGEAPEKARKRRRGSRRRRPAAPTAGTAPEPAGTQAAESAREEATAEKAPPAGEEDRPKKRRPRRRRRKKSASGAGTDPAESA
jgi:ribonuclease E